MIRSMTGYGAATVDRELGEFTAEIRSLNNRFLDLNIRLPREFGFLEMPLRDVVKKRIRRGKVDLFLRWTAAEGAPALYEINRPLLRHYAAEVRAALGLAEGTSLDAAALLQLPGAVNPTRAAVNDDALLEAAVAAVRGALDAMDATRVAEGSALAAAIGALLDEVARLRDEVAGRKDELTEEYRLRLRDRVATIEKQLGTPVDPVRIETEVLLHADRSDITEELVRLETHIAAFRGLCANSSAESVGKGMDFLTQELLREANTIGNKARGLEIATRVVRMKGEIEKIREQVQNIE
jgi:uncharacterized protein (TIGR00255 family)